MANKNTFPKWIEEKEEIRKLKKWEAAWLAGVIDGEGSIGLYNYGKEGRRVLIQMSNTSEDFVKRMREIIGAGSSVRRYKWHKTHKGRKVIYYYSLKGSNRCYKILKQIIPFLVIKKQKALDIIRELEEKPFGRWANATEEARLIAGNKSRERWANPKFRNRMIQKMREYYKDEVNLRKHRERMQALWQARNALS